MAKLLFLFALLGIGAGVYYVLSCGGDRTPPKMDPEEWWGPKELKGRVDKTVKPFKVKFEESVRFLLLKQTDSLRNFGYLGIGWWTHFSVHTVPF